MTLFPQSHPHQIGSEDQTISKNKSLDTRDMFFLWAVAFLLHVYAVGAGDPCPAKALLAPCTCNFVNETTATPDVDSRPKRSVELEGGSCTVVECKESKSISTLEEIVDSALNRKLIDKLVVANVPPRKEHSLARLPDGWLKKVRVRHFQVSDSKMSGDFIWQGNPFAGQEKSLLWFSANKCSLTGSLTFDAPGTVNTKGLNLLPSIQGVDLSDNYLTMILPLSFRYPPANLSTVILSRNSIQSVEAGTFAHAPLLRHVDLSHNLLESIARGVFASPARHLEQIDLSWNSLTYLTVDFFVNMPLLKVVNMSNNFLYSMPDKPWVVVWKQLQHIDVTGNFVECNCELMWLLSMLSPKGLNVSTTAAPFPLSAQIVKGTCSKTIEPRLFSIKYDLVSLTRERLTC